MTTLRRANAYIRASTPMGRSFVPLDKKCAMLKAASVFRVRVLSVALAASLFQRVCRRLRDAGLMDPDAPPPENPTPVEAAGYYMRKGFVCGEKLFCDGRTFGAPLNTSSPTMVEETYECNWALVAYAVCVNLAVKAVHCITPRKRGYCINALLSSIRWQLSPDDVLNAELWVLQILDWDVVPVSVAGSKK